MIKRLGQIVGVCWVFLGVCAAAAAQTPGAGDSQRASASGTTPPRQTTTFLGDTGLWFVPTGEVLPGRGWSASGYRVNLDRQEGFTDISHFAVTLGYGLGGRAEVFGSWRVVTRVDRDIRPLFLSGNDAGGPVNDLPLVTRGWIGNQVGDLTVGAKVSLTSERRGHPAAFAVRGLVKVPTGDEASGASSGKADVAVDGVLSRELGQRVELSGFGGVVFRGDPSSVDLVNGFRWGVGAGLPTRHALRATVELHGEAAFDDVITRSTPATASDGSVVPATSPWRSPVDLALGATWTGASGIFVGGGLSVALALRDRESFGSGFGSGIGDRLGGQVRVGYHPGGRVTPPPPEVPQPPAAPANRPPTVRARCEPCTVEIGASSQLTADAQDPDGDPLTYRWTAPTGSLAAPSDRQTAWTAPMAEGPVAVTVAVADGRGGTASDTVTIQVVRPTVREFVFEDVHFDFDRYTLRPEAVRLLDEAVAALQANPTLRIDLEGHTCNIGTAEYNLALGERRAHAVRDYLVSRGIDVARLAAVSYGEERPKHDNAREETRRLNRRAGLVVRVQR